MPGNHDVSRKACSAYFDNCEADGAEPKAPYWPKWRQFLAMFEEFYRGVPGVTFQVDQEWTLFEMPDLPVVVAGLNSTMAERHQETDHYGWVGAAQCGWFADRLRAAQDRGWLRIGAVHHNLVRGAVRDEENLRDVDTLERVLGDRLNLVLHGHTHDARLHYLGGSALPVLTTGSAAVEEQARPTEVPNQYQVVVIRPDGFVRYARQYARAEHRWIGDTRVDPDGSRWWQETAWQPAAVGGTFPSGPSGPSGSAPGPELERRDRRTDPERAPRRSEDFVERVAEVCRLRHPDASVTRVHPPDGPPYLRVSTVEDRFVVQRPVGVAEHRMDSAALEEFVEQVHRRRPANQPTRPAERHEAPADLVRVPQRPDRPDQDDHGQHADRHPDRDDRHRHRHTRRYRAQYCIAEYFRVVAARFDGGFDPARARPAELTPPAGLLLVARLHGEPVGCGARRFPDRAPPEIKRMWVAPPCVGSASAAGCSPHWKRARPTTAPTPVRLDTNRALTEATTMYRAAGYREVTQFNDEPHAHHWFEKDLDR